MILELMTLEMLAEAPSTDASYLFDPGNAVLVTEEAGKNAPTTPLFPLIEKITFLPDLGMRMMLLKLMMQILVKLVMEMTLVMLVFMLGQLFILLMLI